MKKNVERSLFVLKKTGSVNPIFWKPNVTFVCQVYFMIIFDLQCSSGHSFEGWFDDGHAFEIQKEKGLLVCPICNDNNICKMPSTFAIKATQPTAPPVRRTEELAALGEKITEYVQKYFDDVGSDFAKEALKMHYGVAEQRNIRGLSTKEEEKVLKEEGVPFFKIPARDVSDT
jgi:hypothetical protein